MRISQLADAVGVPTSTVRFYERIGLLEQPTRTSSGYRDYDDSAAERLLFVNRARTMGLSCDQISDLLSIWEGGNCAGAQAQVIDLITRKRSEIAERIAELRLFSAQLESVRVALRAAPPPATCRTDLSCCVPASGVVDVEVQSRKPGGLDTASSLGLLDQPRDGRRVRPSGSRRSGPN